MAEYIPFITSDDTNSLFDKYYNDADIVRVPLDRAVKLLQGKSYSSNVWIDPCVDGMDDLESRRSQPWFDFMRSFDNFEKIGAATYYAKPVASEVYSFVKAVMDKCAAYKPAWISIPQIPLAEKSERNKINRALAAATGEWKRIGKFSGRLILPLVFTNQNQLNMKTARNMKVAEAERCYREAQADGFWVVDSSLTDDSGSRTLRDTRFPGLVRLHEELNECISAKIRIAGPYWGFNLVLWARGLVDYPAIGIGTGYQYFLAGGHGRLPSVKLALPSLRRRAKVGPRLKIWLDAAISKLSSSHPAYSEFNEIKKRYPMLSQPDPAKRQVAAFYKQWFNKIAAAPKAGRSLALFQDLSAAYALGKSLPDLADDEKTARNPEAVVEPLMLSCL
jgi:hypothetical protein